MKNLLPYLNIVNFLILVTAGVIFGRSAFRKRREQRRTRRRQDRISAVFQAIGDNPAWNPEGNRDWSKAQQAIIMAAGGLVGAFVRPALIWPEHQLLEAVDALITAVEEGGSTIGYPRKELAELLLEVGFQPVAPDSVAPNTELTSEQFYKYHLGSLVYALQHDTALPEPEAKMKYTEASATGRTYA